MKKLEKRVLVSGAHGFIGTHLTTTLKALGHSVVNIPRDHLSDPELLLAFLQAFQPDWIFHLAAYGNMSHQTDEQEIFLANTLGTWSLLSASRDIPYEAFINVSSSSVLLPHETFYSATKAASERFVKAFVNKYAKPIVTVRPASVYGPGEADYRFIPTIFRSCLTGEAMTLAPFATHDWIYITDIIDRLIATANGAGEVPGQTLNLSTGITAENTEVVSMIELITGKEANIAKRKNLREFDTSKWFVPSNWPQSVPLRRGLEQCYDYYKARYNQ
jgi:nucleoside-diphosphate-sugar epimerase